VRIPYKEFVFSHLKKKEYYRRRNHLDIIIRAFTTSILSAKPGLCFDLSSNKGRWAMKEFFTTILWMERTTWTRNTTTIC